MESLQDINPVERALVNKATANRTPINATIELTPTCNFRCDMCYIRLSPTEMAASGKLRTVNVCFVFCIHFIYLFSPISDYL